MSLDDVKSFFQRLKETCKKIDQDVSEVKEKVRDLPGNEELACKRICENQDKIETFQKETNELKFDIDTQLAHTAEFIQHFKELIADTEVSITRHENYLKEYGYKPLKTVEEETSAPVDNPISSPVKDKSIKDEVPRTPNLLDYGIVSNGSSSSTLNRTKFEKENSSTTPTLDITNVKTKCPEKNSNVTPTLDGMNINMNDKETPPGPPLFVSRLPDFPSTPTLEL